MSRPFAPRALLAATLTAAIAGCASVPQPDIRRNLTPMADPAEEGSDRASGLSRPGNGANLREATGERINTRVAATPAPDLPVGGEATFNFEGESLHAVVKAILGDLLQQNYVIAPGVQGTVTLATPQPVSAAQALSLLEMVLGWNNARLVWTDGRYNVVPGDQAVAGNLAPRTGPPANARGFELRAVPLQFISAMEMEKILKPYARNGAVLQVDPSRNLIVVGGTRAELENYLRTVEIFDVDWLAGMSVGVFPVQSAEIDKIVTQLEKLFGEQEKSPLAGMFRFLPAESSNAIIVITPQPKYLRDIREWIEKLDMAGEGSRLFVYEVKYMKAADLATQLGSVFGINVSTPSSGRAELAPGLTPVDIGNVARPAEQVSQPPPPPAATTGGTSAGSGLPGGEMGISAVEENNALLVRASPAQWESIRRAIDRIDLMPAQVHIEAQVLEVSLTGNLSYGVSWFFDNAIDDDLRGIAQARGSLGTYAGSLAPAAGGAGSALNWTWLGRDAQAVINALDAASDVRILSTPSLFVRNNVEATLNVGQNIPVASTSFNPGVGTPGSGDNVISTVQYITTGTKLAVKPRISANGMVFMEIDQEISSPGDAGVGGNPQVNSRTLTTEAVVRDGETVMLAGLITDNATLGRSGLPGLSRVPVLGGLFGRQTQGTSRSEVVVLITPRVVRHPDDARRYTDEYGERFRALQPLRASEAAPTR